MTCFNWPFLCLKLLINIPSLLISSIQYALPAILSRSFDLNHCLVSRELYEQNRLKIFNSHYLQLLVRHSN
jgi:hypothetical protein